MKKRLLSLALALILTLTLLPAAALAADPTSGSCGDNATWSYDASTSTLTISGTGPISDYSSGSAPWYPYRGFQTLIIESGITAIGKYAFYNCVQLPSVTIPSTVKEIGVGAFEGCGKLTSITISEGVTSISGSAFSSCKSLTNVVIPSTVKNLDAPFNICTSLTEINVHPNNTSYISKDGVVFSKDETKLVAYPAAKSGSTYTIPDGVTSIGLWAFNNCENLSSITLPDSVTDIGESAFIFCSALEKVTIPDGVQTLSDQMFHSCTSLTEVTIPDTVTGILDRVFAGCSKLSVVNYAGTNTQWGAITIGLTNDPLSTATINYNFEYPAGSTSKPEPEQGEWRLGYGPVTLPTATKSVPYSTTPRSATIETSPFAVWVRFELDGGDLPDGLRLDPDTCEISGTPQESGTFRFTIKRSWDDGGNTASDTTDCTLTILDDSTEWWLGKDVTLPQGVKYVPYSTSGSCAGWEGFRYELVDGALPSGLSLNAETCEISGIPQASGTFKFTIREICLNELGGYADNGDSDFMNRQSYLAEPSESGEFDVDSLWNGAGSSGGSGEQGAVRPGGTSKPSSSSGGGSSSGVATGSDETTCTLSILDNTNEEVRRPNDYEIIQPVGTEDANDPNNFIKTSYSDETLIIDGEFDDFMELYLDGRKLERGVEYTAEEGSTRITIRANTFRRAGEGRHTIAAEFRANGQPNGTLKTVSQNYTLKLPSSSSSHRRPSSDTSEKADPSVWAELLQKNTMPFGDVLPSHWFYNDLLWAYQLGLIQGVDLTHFAPSEPVSQAVIVTVLARLSKVDLTQFAGAEEPGIGEGYFKEAAIWARRSGLLPKDAVFTGNEPTTREGMAILLTQYLASMGEDVSAPAQPVTFADADAMSAQGGAAFQALYSRGIFLGTGGMKMDPAGTTTRAQFIALVHRINSMLES